MSKPILTAVLLSALAGASATAQPYDQPAARGDLLPTHRVSGVIVRESSRVAIVNGALHREGDVVDEAKILQIEPGTVHLAFGSREYTLYVGAKSAHVRTTGAPVDMLARERSITVLRGETLSGIAERYLEAGVSRHQTMIALYEANPQAFSGNINRLREGAVLNLPDAEALRRLPPEAASAQVVRQTDAWRISREPATRLARTADPGSYGPVRSGETLSGIAERVSPDGVTQHQTMIALFEANPRDFGGNINLLYEGAVLDIPDTAAWIRQAPEAATVEVIRQTTEWHSGLTLRARLATPLPTPIAALRPNHDRL